MRKLYNTIAAALVRLIVAYCTPRKRYVDYVHPAPGGGERTYMRRYVIFGYRTGDAPQRAWRAWLPNLYLHHMHAPDADMSLHDHPWPWGLSFVLLGGYIEWRFTGPHATKNTIDQWLRWMTMADVVNETEVRTHAAPAFNYIPGGAFHRVAALETAAQLEARGALWYAGRAGRRAPEGGTWTLFLAGPRRHNKAWGYLVQGRGYVHQAERHRELGAKEVRP